MKEKLTDPVWAAEVTVEIKSKSELGLSFGEGEVNINLCDRPPTAEEARAMACMVKPAGKSRGRFVYLLVRAFLIIEVTLTLSDMFDQSNKNTNLIPREPQYAQQISE